MSNLQHRLSLTGRLYLVLAMTTVGIFCALFITIWWTESDSLETMLQQNGRSLASGLEQNIRLGVQLGEAGFVRDGAASVVANPDILSVDIYEAGGQRIVMLKDEHVELSMAQLRSSFQTGLIFETLPGGKQERLISTIRTTRGEVIGYSVLDLSRASINRTLESSLMISATISILLLLLLWWMAWLAIRQLRRPLDELDRAVEAITLGQLDVTINADIPDPLARIARGFNDMTGALVKNRESIRRHTTALEKSEQRFRELFTHMPVAMYMADIDGTLQQSNPAMAELFGYETPVAMLDAVADITELYKDAGDRELLIVDLMRMQSVTSRETIFVSKRYGELQCLLYARLVKDELGQPQGVEGVIQDMTKLKLLEDNLLQAQKMEAVGQLAGGVAHDFNNLLSVILANADLLSIHVATDEKSYRYTSRIMEAAKRAAEVTANLLSFARKGETRREPVLINTLLEEVLNLIRETCDRRVRVTFQRGDGNLRLMGDPGQLHQVFMNLAINALHAMPDGGELSLSTHSAKGNVIIQVADTGMGMTEKVLKQIFEPFYTTKETGKGTGLGLAMVYGIIEKQGGDISVDSMPGKGTCFEITLPLYRGEGESAASVHASSTLEQPALSGRVLLVDDEEMLRVIGREVLGISGLDIHTAVSGEQALEILDVEELRPDVVLLDMNMPGIGGLATLRKIRKHYGDLKVIIMTGYSETTIESDRDELRYDGFVSKPYQPSDLCAEVSRVLEK